MPRAQEGEEAMSGNLLRNAGFEADWGEENSHRCLVLPEGASPYEMNVGNIFTPPGWITWFRHLPYTWDQPEVRDARAIHDPRRVHGGEKGMLLFTFYRKHDAGFLQQVEVTPGHRLRLGAWAHAWSNSQNGPREDDAHWSEGPGYDPGFLLVGDSPPEGSPGTYSDWMNFGFWLGIDPTGGTNPFADTVVWGRGAHIYNEHAPVPEVQATAQGGRVTVFLRSKTIWAFKHNDAYWDDANLADEDAAPDVQLSWEPIEPEVGATVKVSVTSDDSFDEVGLEVKDPSGTSVGLVGPFVDQVGDTTRWRWTWVPERAGSHLVQFMGGAGAQVLAEATLDVKAATAAHKVRLSFECLEPTAGDRVGVAVSSLVDVAGPSLAVTDPDGGVVSVGDVNATAIDGQYVWQWTFVAESAGTFHVRFTAEGDVLEPAEGNLVVAEPLSPGGVPPRLQYARVYVLMPQDAGREWVSAVLQSGKWEERRWTIGSSADDAGVGPRNRTVIAVNPGRWSGDLKGFFDQYYPGVNYVRLEADSPDDLVQRLRQL
jgi:hypothetical protein